ncbi:MAG: hypothetical protein LBN04_05630 [Oscillospiraceae bacterium]|jgi:hypothetical protein|nr:hypothetical protein [Oscillospiraceae bacterium]
MLYIGDNRRIPQREIVAILPHHAAPNKARIVLADGREVYAPVAAVTLKKRLDAPMVGADEGQA